MDKEQATHLPQASAGNFLHSTARRALSWLDRHSYQALAWLIFFSAALGLVKLWIDPPNWDFNWENRWWQIAVQLSRGEGYVSCKEIYFPLCGSENQVTAMREPLPVLLFALIARLTNESLLAASVAVLITNLLLIPAVYILTNILSNPRAGLLAALLWAAYLAPMRLLYNLISGDLLASFFLVVGLVFLLHARQKDKNVLWLAAGVCMGAASLSRSAFLVTSLVLTFGLVLWPLAVPHKDKTYLLRPAALFSLALSITISPWLIRNYIVFQQPVIGSTLSGYYLYRQNHMLPEDDFIRFVTGAEFAPLLQDRLTHRPDLSGIENEAQMDQIYRQEALMIIRSHPTRYAILSTSRFLMLWFNWRVNEEYNRHNNLVDLIILLQHGLLLVAWLLLSIFVRLRSTWPLTACILAYHLLYMAVMAHLPYIIAIQPLIVTIIAVGAASVMAYRSGSRTPTEPVR